MSNDVGLPTLWNGVPFYGGDTVLLEWNNGSRAVWVVDTSYTDYESDEDDEPYDLNEEGFLMNGSENVYPDRLTVLPPGSTPISLDGYAQVELADLRKGDDVILVVGSESLTVQHKLSYMGGQDEDILWDVLGMQFFAPETVFYRKEKSA